MVSADIVFVLSAMIATLLGFATHRASLCSVRAVAEFLSTGRAFMLASFIKAAIWALLVTVPVLWFSQTQFSEAVVYPINLLGIGGGFLFGLGASINGACAFSTLAYLADGELSMVASLSGFCAGVALWARVLPPGFFSLPDPAKTFIANPSPWAISLFILLALWAVTEIGRLWRTRPLLGSIWHLACAKRYRLSTGAVVLGICSGLLFSLHGHWTYTTLLKHIVINTSEYSVTGMIRSIIFFIAVVFGMILSSWQQHRFALRVRSPLAWLRRLIGGTFMGAGASAIPGGNDEIITHYLPLVSIQATFSFVALILGTAAGLWLARIMTGRSIAVVCTGDIYRDQVVSH